jgi:hypothetical protein
VSAVAAAVQQQVSDLELSQTVAALVVRIRDKDEKCRVEEKPRADDQNKKG